MERDFKGIWIPKEVWLCKDLKAMEKLFLVEIDSLDNEEGCYASNDYFSEFFNLSKNRCSEIIKGLEKKGILEIDYKYKTGTQSIEKRIIKVIGISTEYIRDTDRGIRKTDLGYSEKGEDNNTLSNNTINNKSNIYIPYSEIIDYLNLKANTKYKSSGKKTKDLIKARFNEKYTLEDFKIVIDKKSNEWLGTSFVNYLRPETLFSNKFEGYLNQKEVKKQYGNAKQDIKSTGPKKITGEGEELARRAQEIYGDKLQDFECEF